MTGTKFTTSQYTRFYAKKYDKLVCGINIMLCKIYVYFYVGACLDIYFRTLKTWM